MSSDQAKRTPLCDEHIALGARMVEFAGWYMPIQYKGVREEHMATRTQVGIFDVSHMGEIRVKGSKALEALQWLTTNDVSKLQTGQAQYNLLPNDQGGLVDDIFIYCIQPGTEYFVCVNAANKDKDYAWMLKNNKGAEIVDESADWAQLAVQGPNASELIQKTLGIDVAKMGRNLIHQTQFAGAKVILATTGYTGEKGAEIFIQKNGVVELWKGLLAMGKDLGVQPIGLGARDTLRTEMKYSLYGHEIDDQSNPYEAGLGWVIKPTAKDFIGKAKIVGAKESGLKRALVGFKMLEKGIPRQDYPLCNAAGDVMGKVTSGTHSPSLDEPIGIGYVSIDHGKVGSKIWVDIRGRKVAAQVVETPFVKR